MASREVFHFDEFTLDVQERRLLRGAEDGLANHDAAYATALPLIRKHV